ncbi:MAG: protein-L-isoaspartate O-methyltransferase [Pseudomonadota bacterium]
MPDYAARRTMMVDTQIRPSDVTKFPIIDTFLSVPREQFVPAAQREAAYMGENIAIAPGRVVLEPRTLAKILDALDVQPHELVLDIGTGLGYSAAVLSRLGEVVVAVEEDDTFAAEAETALSEFGADNVILVHAPLTEGAPKHGPYDAIVVQGGVETIPPAVLDQLKEGGRIAAVFMEGALGVCRIGYMVDGTVSWRFAFNAGAPVLQGYASASDFVF